jgi:Zn-dependent protease with chaperone function
MYTNLLLFLVAIFIFSVDSVPDVPLLPLSGAFPLLLLMLAGYSLLSVKFFRRRSSQAGNYFKTEKLLSILALFFFGITLYLCDPKYYISQFKFAAQVPSLVSFFGLLIFVLYLVLLWRAGRKSYERIFGRKYTSFSFIVSNLKANLPIVLPWIVLSLLYDVVALVPWPGLQRIVASPWGDLFFFGIFLLFVLLFFPPLVRRLWNCKKLPEGYLKDHLDDFCKRQNFNADFYLWPLFEGRVLTAGVMGIVPGLRYILITPALIETMSMSELEAIMAHEIGHVKKYHLLLYVFLIGGFSLLTGLLAEPTIHLLLSMEFVHTLMLQGSLSAEDVVTLVGAVPLLFFLLIYFRFVFGYFIRNFERQADLYSLERVGSSGSLVSAFEKISMMSGNIRNQKNWHHFGIGERIDCLEAAEQNPDIIIKHNRKVGTSLFIYIGVIALAIVGFKQLPTEALAERYQERFAETILMQRAVQEPDRALWQRLIGDLMLTRKMEAKALAAYEKAFSIDPTNPEVMNNYAWLLLTSKDLELRDPPKALTLARGAATLQAKGYILDTLATAYWANGLVNEAVRVEEQAIGVDVAKQRFYQAQIAKFMTQTYDESVQVMQE